jgi:hypothetical protein
MGNGTLKDAFYEGKHRQNNVKPLQIEAQKEKCKSGFIHCHLGEKHRVHAMPD